MPEWEEMPLGDVLTLQRGFDLPERSRKVGSYPVVSSSGITGSHDEFKVDPPGVVIGRYGSLGSVFWIDEPFWPLNTSLWVKDFKGNDPRYLSYLLQTVTMDGSAAAAVPGVNRNHLHKIHVRVPDKTIQRRIAALLAAFDEAIGINRRRIQVVSRLATAVYRDRFVRGRPMSGGKLSRPGWRRLSITDICSLVQSGSTPRRSDPNNWAGGTISWFKTGELRDGPLFDSSEKVTELSGARIFEPPAILMAIYGSPTVGRLGWITAASSCNQAALVLRARDPAIEQDWLWYELAHLRDHFNAMAQGAAQQNISKQKVADTIVEYPPHDALREFADLVRPMRALWENLAASALRLSSIRDLLLPRVVTGRLDISQVDLGILTPTEPE